MKKGKMFTCLARSFMSQRSKIFTGFGANGESDLAVPGGGVTRIVKPAVFDTSSTRSAEMNAHWASFTAPMDIFATS